MANVHKGTKNPHLVAENAYKHERSLYSEVNLNFPNIKNNLHSLISNSEL